MRRGARTVPWLLAVVSMFSIAATACGASDGPTSVAAEGPSPASQAVVGPTRGGAPPASESDGATADLFLGELGEGLAEELDADSAPSGFAVFLPERGQLYAYNGYEPFPMASVAKIVIILAFLDQLSAGGDAPSDNDLDLLARMIVESDNNAADALWGRIGGAAGVSAFLDSQGIRGISFLPGSLAWGDGTASAAALSELLGRLYGEELLDESGRRLVMSLLAGVSDGQRWGVSAAFPSTGREQVLGIKNGWFPAAEGWWASSAALAVDAAIEPMVIVGLSHGESSLEDAIARFEAVASLVRAAVYEGPEASPYQREAAAFRTAVQVFSPTPLGLDTFEGECRESDVIERRAGAYACLIADAVYDPCFAAPDGAGSVAVCRAEPGGRSAAFGVPVPAIERGPTVDAARAAHGAPWFVELDDGTGCREPTPADPPDANGLVVTFVCTDGRLILEELDEGAAWWAYAYDPRFNLGFQVRVAAAWY